MAANILLDYAFKFSEVTGTQKADLSYLKNLAVIVKSKTPGGTSPLTHNITSAEDAAQYTNATDLAALFAGGMSIVTLVICDAIADATTALDNTKQYTALIDNEWTVDEAIAFDPTDFKGVIGAVFGDTAGDRTKAETYAAGDNRCAFVDATDPKAYGMYYAFAKLLSGAYWRDQQYIQVTSNEVTTIVDLGEAEALFLKKVSFYLGDDQYGKRLGFFGAGGSAITQPYVNEEIKRITQSTGVNYLALNQPRNIPISRILLENALQDKIDEYKLPPYQYLDPTGTNEIVLTTSNEAFVLNGQMTTKVAEPIWRVKVEARQEAQ